jgi:GNAT superfamily N-acetyltransferase
MPDEDRYTEEHRPEERADAVADGSSGGEARMAGGPPLVLGDLSPADLAEAADANLIAHAAWVHRRLPGMQVLEDPELVVINSNLVSDTLNLVCRARLAPDRATGRARATLERFTAAGIPFSWWIGPADRPEDLGDRLLGLGMVNTEGELAMAADLNALRADPPPDDLRITRVRTEDELRHFGRLLVGALDPPDVELVRFYELASPLLLEDDCPQWLYVGYLGDEAVATGQLTVGGGVVGLYNVFTSPAHRRRGIGTALTVRPLIDARGRGHRTAVLQATPDGAGIYERLGFRAFGRIMEYKPAPAEP